MGHFYLLLFRYLYHEMCIIPSNSMYIGTVEKHRYMVIRATRGFCFTEENCSDFPCSPLFCSLLRYIFLAKKGGEKMKWFSSTENILISYVRGRIIWFLALLKYNFLEYTSPHLHDQIQNQSMHSCFTTVMKAKRIFKSVASVSFISFNKKDTFCNCFNQLGLTQLKFRLSCAKNDFSIVLYHMMWSI